MAIMICTVIGKQTCTINITRTSICSLLRKQRMLVNTAVWKYKVTYQMVLPFPRESTETNFFGEGPLVLQSGPSKEQMLSDGIHGVILK